MRANAMRACYSELLNAKEKILCLRENYHLTITCLAERFQTNPDTIRRLLIAARQAHQ